MASKLKQRRMRRLKADVAWWREEAEDCRSRMLELAGEIDRLKKLVIRVPMPVVVPVFVAASKLSALIGVASAATACR
ncbi:TPA: hypothetical protein I3789_002615 [Enterobacter cloacae]|nr:hypothetical protein [Enterobacter cloacae]